MNVTTEQKGSDHVYILVDGKWVASTLPEYAEAVREAVAAYVNTSQRNSTEE